MREPPSDGRGVVTELTRVFGGPAVDQPSFTVEPGSVTGFLGRNGAGKTTTLRMLLGLVHQTSGRSTVSGVPYRQLVRPLTVVGAALEASSYHPARGGRNHLRVMCAAAGLPDRRADEVLDLVGLHDAAKRKVRWHSMGVEVHELRLGRFDLEQPFFALTRGRYAGTEPTAPRPDGGAACSA